MDNTKSVRVLCRKLILTNNIDTPLQWLIGSPFFPQFTIISTVRCLHYSPSDPLSPDFSKEADNLRSLIIKGFHVIGALIVGKNGDLVKTSKKAIDAASKLREILYNVEDLRNFDVIGGVSDSSSNDVKFFAAKFGDLKNHEGVESVFYEEKPGNYVWERGCLLKCEISIKLPVYLPANNESAAMDRYLHANEALLSMFRDPHLTFIMEALNSSSDVLSRPIIVRGSELDFHADISSIEPLADTAQQTEKSSCSYFCSESKLTVDAEILLR